MAQPPFLVDVLQIEPGSGNTLTLSRDSTDGAMKFVDAVLTSGVLLPNLVGLRNVTGVYIVGRAGDGAPYTSVQDALDAVPASSSAAAPSLVLILPGVYTENVTIQKDGVYLMGLGGVTITNDGVSDTVEISAAIETTPQDVLLRGITVANTTGAQSCVRIVGADSFASGTITVNAAPLATGDTIEVGGVVLTGTAGVRTSGSDDFSVSSMTSDGIAAEIVAAINDTANSFATFVEAEATLNVVTLTAITAGSGGNTITLVSTTTPPGNMTDSGATLAGGGSAGSLVGNGIISIDDCDLVASGAAGYQVRADTSGHIRIRGGTWRGSDNASLSTASNCALFSVAGVEWANDFEVAYDTTADRPADTTCEYELLSVGRINGVLSNLSGAGSLAIKNCPVMGTVSQDGDQTLNAYLSNLGALTLNGTTVATLYSSTRTTATQAGGTPTLAEPHIRGEREFVALSTSETITFDIPGPDTNYTVLVENPSPTSTLAIRDKTATEFRIEATPGISDFVGYSIVRSL